MSALVDACLRWGDVLADLDAAKDAVEREAEKLHRMVPVRAIARDVGLSTCTVSEFFRGQLTVGVDNALKLAESAERFQVQT